MTLLSSNQAPDLHRTGSKGQARPFQSTSREGIQNDQGACRRRRSHRWNQPFLRLHQPASIRDNNRSEPSRGGDPDSYHKVVTCAIHVASRTVPSGSGLHYLEGIDVAEAQSVGDCAALRHIVENSHLGGDLEALLFVVP